jgi:hypothetical protein
MSDLQWLGLIVVAAYLASAIWSRMHFIARSSIQALLGRVAEIEATARLRGAKDNDPIFTLLKEVEAYIREADKPWHRLFSTGAIENRGWITAHYCERLLLSLPGYQPEYLYARLRREGAELSKLPAREARAWRVLVDRHLDETGKKRDGSTPKAAEADLSQLLGRANRYSDAYHTSLAELYNKSVWLILAGLLFVAALIVASPDAVPLLGAGAIGGLASRILRISSASDMPTDYGALWVPLFLSPVLGALLGWAGILLLTLGQEIDVIALSAIDLSDETSASVLALAMLFGFTERFFNGVANLVADKVSGAPSNAGAAPAQPAPPPEPVPPPEPAPPPEPVPPEEIVVEEQVVPEQPSAPEEPAAPEQPIAPEDGVAAVASSEPLVGDETIVPDGKVVSDETDVLEDKDV